MSVAACAILYHADDRRTKAEYGANVQRQTEEQPNTSRKATAVERKSARRLFCAKNTAH